MVITGESAGIEKALAKYILDDRHPYFKIHRSIKNAEEGLKIWLAIYRKVDIYEQIFLQEAICFAEQWHSLTENSIDNDGINNISKIGNLPIPKPINSYSQWLKACLVELIIL